MTNIWASSSFLLLTEMSVIKALMVLKWSWIVGVDEQFAGTFLVLLNGGYILVSQSARFVPKSYFLTLSLTQGQKACAARDSRTKTCAEIAK